MLTNILTKSPNEIASALRAVLYALILFEVLRWSEAQLAGVLLAVEAVLYLFTRTNTVGTGTLHLAGVTKQEVLDAADPSSGVTMQSSSTNGTRGLAVLLALGLGVANVACTRAQPAVAPETSVVSYAADVLSVTADLQRALITYATTSGGNATSDRIMRTISDDVVPAARQARDLAVAYHAITDPTLRTLKASELDGALAKVLTAYATVSTNLEVAELASQVEMASANVRRLIAQIRLAIVAARGSGMTSTGDVYWRRDLVVMEV